MTGNKQTTDNAGPLTLEAPIDSWTHDLMTQEVGGSEAGKELLYMIY